MTKMVSEISQTFGQDKSCIKKGILIILNFGIRINGTLEWLHSLVVSDLRSETKGSRFKSGC